MLKKDCHHSSGHWDSARVDREFFLHLIPFIDVASCLRLLLRRAVSEGPNTAACDLFSTVPSY